MSNAASRGDRRRRVLNEEIISASREAAAYSGDPNGKTSPGRRFVLTPGDVSSAIATRVFPRSHWITAVLVIAMVAVCSGLAFAHRGSTSLALTMGPVGQSMVDLQSATSIGGWLTSSLLIALAIYCTLVMIVRSRRADDFKGRYRWWGTAAVTCVVLSLCGSTGLHEAVAATLARITSLSLLPNHAIWWLVPAVAFGGWLIARLIAEVAESRISLVLMLLGVVAVSASAGSAIVADAGSLPPVIDFVPQLLNVVGVCLLFAGVVAYSRHIAAQVAGGVTVASTRAVSDSKSEPPPLKLAGQGGKEDSEPQPKTKAKAKAKSKRAAGPVVQWTDGSDGSSTSDFDEQENKPRKLSKAERKRLRRAQQRRAA